MMRTELLEITPSMAKEFLKRNCVNRRLSRHNVDMMVSDILNGEWKTESPTFICFSNDGELLDGQHRLNAIVKADIPVKMYVMYGVDKEAVIDRGQTRNSFQELYMRGQIPQNMASQFVQGLVNFCLLIEHPARCKFSDSERKQFIIDHLDDINAVESIVNGKTATRYNHRTNFGRTAPIASAVFYAYKSGVDTSKLKEFMDILSSGFMLSNNQSAAIVLRNYVMDHKGLTSSGSYRKELMMMTEMAIYDFINDNPRKYQYKNLHHVYANLESNK